MRPRRLIRGAADADADADAGAASPPTSGWPRSSSSRAPGRRARLCRPPPVLPLCRAAAHPSRSRQEFILLSDVFGVSALIDALNNPRVGTSTESSVLGPFFTEDAADGAPPLSRADAH